MQKIITISAVAAVLSLPAFAEIANNATCNTTNLGQSNNNSTANVEANWNANTININWYNGDTRILQNTCTYDSSITLPTEPTKPGYTFAGWRLRTTCPSGTYSINSQCLTLAQAVASCTTGTYFNGVSCVACDSMLNGTCIIGTGNGEDNHGCPNFQTQEMCEYANENWGRSTGWYGNYSDTSGYGIYVCAYGECLWNGDSCWSPNVG